MNSTATFGSSLARLSDVVPSDVAFVPELQDDLRRYAAISEITMDEVEWLN